jgi:hypothetical protein
MQPTAAPDMRQAAGLETLPDLPIIRASLDAMLLL